MAHQRSHRAKLPRWAKLALAAGWSLLVLIGASGPAAIEPPPAYLRQAPTPCHASSALARAGSFPLLASENPSLGTPDSPSSPGAVVSRTGGGTAGFPPRGRNCAQRRRSTSPSPPMGATSPSPPANNLIAGARNPDHDGYENVFLVDVQTGEVSLVSAAVDGAPGDGWSSGPALSAGGRYIAYYSWASDLTSDDSNAVQDVFVHDRQYGTNERVSISTRGAQANGRSGDGRLGTPYFRRRAWLLSIPRHRTSSGDTNAADVFVRDRRRADSAFPSLRRGAGQRRLRAYTVRRRA